MKPLATRAVEVVRMVWRSKARRSAKSSLVEPTRAPSSGTCLEKQEPLASPRPHAPNYYTLLLTLAAVPRLVLLVLAAKTQGPALVLVALRASLQNLLRPLLPAP